ncbi:maleylpyruvate isomerase family mycothiol-dependent enzyme [Nocardioides dilutus]
MQDDAYWETVARLRLGVADQLETLSDADWDAPSLCEGWRVRDVAGHLSIIPTVTTAELVAAMPRNGFNLHRVNTFIARRYGAGEPAAIVASIREHAHDRTTAKALNTADSLFDLVVHGQDMFRPLGQRFEVSADVAAAGLDRVWEMGWPFRARQRLAHVTLTATDAAWTTGSGPEVRGPAVALLLLLTGRTRAASGDLRGPGVELVR